MKSKFLKNVLNTIKNDSVFLIILIYFTGVFIIFPFKNFAIGDDYYFVTQVSAFFRGIFVRSALVSPTFVLQGLLGDLWSKIFGLNYASLRSLTSLVISPLCIFGFSKLLNQLEIIGKRKFITLFLIVFNPIFFVHTMTFMTEIYFLMFISWSLYFFLKYLNTQSIKLLLLASLLGGMSFLVRQYGAVLFVAYVAVYLLQNGKNINYKRLMFLVFPFLSFILIGLFWPQFKSEIDPRSINPILYFSSFHTTWERIANFKLFPYIGFFLLPFTIPYLLKIKRVYLITILLLSIPLTLFIYRMDIFAYGNLFYVEGLYARLLPNIRENIFNNILFRIFLSYMISVSLTFIFYLLIKSLILNVKHINEYKFTNLKLNENLKLILLILLIIGFYLIVTMTLRIFDRYMINVFTFTIILASLISNKYELPSIKLIYLLCFLIFTISYLQIYDHFTQQKLKWDLAQKVQNITGVGAYQIYVDNVYARATRMALLDNYTGFFTVTPDNYAPICFIQEYVRPSNNILNNAIQFIEAKGIVQKHFSIPVIPYASLLKGDSNHFDKTDKLFFDKEYKTPLYNLLGKRMFVRAFCVDGYESLKSNEIK